MNLPSIDEATAARNAGDLRRAAEICRDILVKDPFNLDAKSLIGVCLVEGGAPEKGRDFILEAVANDANHWRYRLNLSVLHENDGKLDDAIVEAKTATTLPRGDRFESWGRLGALLGKAGDFEGATEALGKAHALNPGHSGLALLLAGAYAEVRNWSRAHEIASTVPANDPGYQEALRLQCQSLRQRGQWRRLEETAERWRRTDPASDEARLAHSFALSQQGYYDAAAEVYRPLAERTPPDAENIAALGRLYLGGRRMAEAEACFASALKSDDQCAEAAYGLSRLAMMRGDFDTSAALSKKAVAADPAHAEAFAQLVEAARGKIDDGAQAALENLSDNERISLDKRAIAWFARGDVHHAHKQADAAFEAWRRANELKIEHYADDTEAIYDRSAHEDFIALMRSVAASDIDFDADPDPSQPTPIFVVGMPRSGTTLLETALSAHREFAGAGELPAGPFILQQFAAKLSDAPSPDEWREWAREQSAQYFSQYDRFGVEKAQYVVDKMPQNILGVGVLKKLFPAAKFIHIRRNPVETGFSVFRRNFNRQWPFSTRLDAIAHYYGEYSRIAAHWENTYPDDVAFVQFEDLATDFEGCMRRMVAACGAAWDDRCLTYYEVERNVLTFSAGQVRKPPSREHLNPSAPYRGHLGELIDGLKVANIDLTTGAPVA